MKTQSKCLQEDQVPQQRAKGPDGYSNGDQGPVPYQRARQTPRTSNSGKQHKTHMRSHSVILRASMQLQGASLEPPVDLRERRPMLQGKMFSLLQDGKERWGRTSVGWVHSEPQLCRTMTK